MQFNVFTYDVLRSKAFGYLAAAALTVTFCVTAVAQDQPDSPPDVPGAGSGMGQAFSGVGGQITSIEGSSITLQTFRGDTAKVKVTSSTRVMKDRIPAKLSDFKVGDRVLVSGEQDKDGVWNAQLLAQRTGAGGPHGMMGGMQVKPEDNGKTYIMGELIKIEGTKLTVKKPDNTEQIIEVDDDTSFRNLQHESVTLPDIKVGEFVRGMGAVKDGVFVPKELNAGRPRGPRLGTPPPPPPDAASPQPPPAMPDASGEKK